MIQALSMLLGGLFMALVGFNILKLKAKTTTDQEKMIIWRNKYSIFFKYGGILIILIGSFLFFVPKIKSNSNSWTETQKSKMKQSIIKSSNFLRSMNPDTANLVVTCFVDKYATKYTIQDAWKQDKMSQEQINELIQPILTECYKIYGIKIKY